MNKLTAIDWVALVLVVVGGLNWGLHALGMNIVDPLGPSIAMIVYLLVGVAAIYVAVMLPKFCRR